MVHLGVRNTAGAQASLTEAYKGLITPEGKNDTSGVTAIYNRIHHEFMQQYQQAQQPQQQSQRGGGAGGGGAAAPQQQNMAVAQQQPGGHRITRVSRDQHNYLIIEGVSAAPYNRAQKVILQPNNQPDQWIVDYNGMGFDFSKLQLGSWMASFFTTLKTNAATFMQQIHLAANQQPGTALQQLNATF